MSSQAANQVNDKNHHTWLNMDKTTAGREQSNRIDITELSS
jgi:hypothetical protein